MMTRRHVLAAAIPAGAAQRRPFSWPPGKKAALSLTFDDARASQITTAIPLLDACRTPATLYVSPPNVLKLAEDWKRVAAAGRHEIGNHSYTHPCTGNYRFAREKALEDFTLEKMAEDLDKATGFIRTRLGVTPVSFAYPCGQKFVGRGENTRSYVPLVAKRFLSGRGYLDEAANDPEVCDLASLMGTGFDGLNYDQMMELMQKAVDESRWLIFVGHDVGQPARQSVDAKALERLCRFAADSSNGIWIDTVETIARYLLKQRKSDPAGDE